MGWMLWNWGKLQLGVKVQVYLQWVIPKFNSSLLIIIKVLIGKSTKSQAISSQVSSPSSQAAVPPQQQARHPQ